MDQFIVILKEVRRVARYLDADRKVKMSKAPRYLRELYNMLHIMSGSVKTQKVNHRNCWIYMDSDDDKVEINAQNTRGSIAEADTVRGESRCIRHADSEACSLALQLE